MDKINLCFAKDYRNKKRCKPTSHRYNRLPLLPSGPGGVQQELVVPTCVAKVEIILIDKYKS
jgi:hypothetical protein